MTATNSTTKAIVQFLNGNGFKAYSVYNGAVYSVKRETYLKHPNKLKGVPDICGFNKKTGKACYVEIKTGKDTLSPYQIQFIKEAKEAGCMVIVAKTFDDFNEQFCELI